MKRTLGFLSILLLLAAGAVAQQPESPEPPAEPDAELEDLLRAPSGEEVEDIDAILEGEEGLFGEGDGYSYDPAGRRDPFQSLLQVSERPELRGPRPEGIPGLLIDEIALIGVLRTPSGWIAQVQAADKQKSYLLKEGDQLYDGEVVSIDRSEVVFKQEVRDPAAIKPFRERVKTLNP